MPARPTRRIVARTAPRHARAGQVDGPRVVLGVISLTLTLVALSYPRGAGAMFDDWLRLATITLAPLVLLPPRRLTAPPWLLLAVVAWIGASVLWSQEATLSVEAVLTYAWITALAFGAATLSAPRTVPVAVALTLALTITMSVVAAALGYEGPRRWEPWGEVGGARVFQGLFGNRNIIAYTLTMLLPAAIVLTFRRRRSALPGALLLVTAVAIIALSGSTTSLVTAVSIVAIAAGLPLLRFLRATRSRRLRGAAAATILLVAAGSIPVVINLLSRRDLTLSGRTPFWQRLVEVSLDRPLTGFGWGTVWNYHWQVAGRNPIRDAINDGPWSPLAHGHNAALDLLPQIGLLGILLMVAFQVRAAIKLARSPRSGVRTWGLLTLLAITMVGLTEPSWAIPLGWGLLVVVATVAERLPAHRQQAPTPQPAVHLDPPPTISLKEAEHAVP